MKYARDLCSMETVRSDLIFEHILHTLCLVSYLSFMFSLFLFVFFWWGGGICDLTLQVPRLGVGWTVYFDKGDWVGLQD